MGIRRFLLPIIVPQIRKTKNLKYYNEHPRQIMMTNIYIVCTLKFTIFFKPHKVTTHTNTNRFGILS